ncbi:MAG: hypothetical protein Ct9H300mP1_21060 [Planctomycetaceae bacterium]|nr:MAG: hypothetical protein Ct9H300mP1_21060 [Planctomycetaceae bacterium]
MRLVCNCQFAPDRPSDRGAHTAVELCQAVQGVGLSLDPSYYICGPHKGSRRPGLPYVYHVYLRDTTPDQIQVQVGLGEVDYGRLISQLRRENYDRTLSVDFFPDQYGDLDRASSCGRSACCWNRT